LAIKFYKDFLHIWEEANDDIPDLVKKNDNLQEKVSDPFFSTHDSKLLKGTSAISGLENT
jgi:hypothetical protein